MLKSDAILESLREYLKKKYDINPDRIRNKTSLLHDLQIKGDDVDEFFSSLIMDFNVEVKRLNLSRFYVGEEPFDFISPVVRFFKKEKASQKPTITINDIEKFIQTGVLE